MIDAALSKLSKIMKTERVFRAPGGLLPAQFWSGDEFSCVGGVEFAFMSATLDREVAMEYATRSKAGVLLEIRQVAPYLALLPHYRYGCAPRDPLGGSLVLRSTVKATVTAADMRASCAPHTTALHHMPYPSVT